MFNFRSLVTILFAFYLPATALSAQDLSPREAAMQRRIETLESRLDEMESIIRALQSQQAEPDAPAADRGASPTAGATGDVDPPSTAGGRDENDPARLEAYFNKGLQLRSADGAFDIRVGGRTQFDAAFFDVDERWERLAALTPSAGLGDEEDGVAFRRARLSIRGTLYENIGFKAQYDFAVNSPGNDGGQFRDVFLELHDVPWIDKVRIGHFQEPFSLEEMTSNSYITFMERSLANVFVPSFNTGVMVEKSGFEGRLHGAVGLFKTTDFWPSDNDSDEAAGYGVTARLSGVPWRSADGRRLLHVAANVARRNPDGAVTLRQRPESYLAQRYVNTGPIDVGSVRTYGVDSALVLGPLSLQGEYITSELGTDLYGKRDFTGYYGALSWFLTGEQRPYRKGAFWRVTPDRNFRFRDGARGWGAWEVALRYSSVDLDDGPVRGGTERNWTAALNWYLNPNTRIMVNYILAQPDTVLYDGDIEILQTRFQVDF